MSLSSVHHVDGSARAGVVHTARGAFTTPCFMPVGTRGAVRLLDADDLDRLGPQVVLANAYHLMLRPGAGGGRGPRRPAPVHRLGRAPPHRLGRVPGVLAQPPRRRRRRHLPVRLRRLLAPPDPRDGGGHAGPAGRRHPDGPGHLHRPARARRGDPPGRRPAPWPGPTRARACPPARPGNACSASSRAAPTPTCGRSTPGPPPTSTSTATASAGCRWESPASSCCPPWPPPWPSSRPTGRAT